MRNTPERCAQGQGFDRACRGLKYSDLLCYYNGYIIAHIVAQQLRFYSSKKVHPLMIEMDGIFYQFYQYLIFVLSISVGDAFPWWWTWASFSLLLSKQTIIMHTESRTYLNPTFSPFNSLIREREHFFSFVFLHQTNENKHCRQNQAASVFTSLSSLKA
jgi:hypothetical protein